MLFRSESVQQWHSRFGSWSAELAKCIKRARSNAANNSNRGTLIVLRGATFDLAVRSETVIEPSILTIRRYTILPQQTPQSRRRKTHKGRSVEYEIRK